MTESAREAWRAYARMQAGEYEAQARLAMTLARKAKGEKRRHWVAEARRMTRAARKRWATGGGYGEASPPCSLTLSPATCARAKEGA